jgi:hypothetical protein
MRGRTAVVTLAAVALAAAAALGLAKVRAGHGRREVEEIAALNARVDSLRDSLETIAAGDSILNFATADSASITVALSEALLVRLTEEAARRYFDRVELHLRDIRGHGEGEIERPTPFGKMTLGDWSVQVAAHRIDAVLASGDPTVDFTGTHRVHLELPMRIREGSGRLRLDFAWDSHSVFNALCRDFESSQEVQGGLLPQRHVVRGDILLSAGPRGIVADPEFPPEKFPLQMALDDDSWQRLRAALEEQNKPRKCGVLLHPEQVLEGLRKLGLNGVRFRLPKTVLRRISMPGSITRTVRILDTPVALSVTPSRLRMTPGRIWYSARIETKKSEGNEKLVPLPSTHD